MSSRESRWYASPQGSALKRGHEKRSAFHVSPAWNWPGGELVQRDSILLYLRQFTNRTGRPEHLYEASAMEKRSPIPIGQVLDRGWYFLSLDFNILDQRKRPTYNQKDLRDMCVKLKVPYWREMRDLEIRSLLILWAIDLNVPEISLDE